MEISARAHRVIADFGTDNLAAMNEHNVFGINNCGDATIREIALYLCSIGKPFKCHDRIMERLSPKKSKTQAVKEPRSGMTLRDQFAAHALPALIDRYGSNVSSEGIAEMAYRISDAMLEARKK